MADSINITLSGTPSAEPFLPTATQKAALAGTGTPSSGNKFVTKDTLDTETSARTSADETLQTNINSEASTRATADTTLQTNITNEATARSEADTALDNAKVDKEGGKGLSTNDFDNVYKAYHDKLAATHDTDGRQKPSGMATQTKTITALTDVPDYIGQPGIDSAGKKYTAIALSGTMWRKDTHEVNKQVAFHTRKYWDPTADPNDPTKPWNYDPLKAMSDIVIEFYMAGTFDTAANYGFTFQYGISPGAAYDYWIGFFKNETLIAAANLNTLTQTQLNSVILHDLTVTSEGTAAGLTRLQVLVDWSAFKKNGLDSYTATYFRNYASTSITGFKFSKNILNLESSPIIARMNEIASVQGDITEINSSLILPAADGALTGVYVPETQYEHPRGETEMKGETAYGSSAFPGEAFYEKMTENVCFNMVQMCAYAGGDSVIQVRIYKSQYFNSNTNPADLTLLDTVDFAAGAFNRSRESIFTVPLSKKCKAPKDWFVYVFVLATSGTAPYIPQWTEAAGESPERHGFLMLSSSGLSTAWNYGWGESSPPFYGSGTFKLKNVENALETRLSNLENYKASIDESGRITGTIPSIQYIHPRGESEYTGEYDYGSGSIKGLALFNKINSDVCFDRVLIRAYAGSTSIIEARIYKSLSATERNPANMELIESVSYSAGGFNQSSESYAEIELANTHRVSKDFYIYVFIYDTSSSHPNIKCWNSYAGEEPERKGFILVGSQVSPWTVGWGNGSEPGYMGTPIKLKLSSVADTALLNSLQDDINELKIPPVRLTLPKKIYAAVGTELNLYNDAVILGIDRGLSSPLNYKIEWYCTVGKVIERGFRFTPVSANAGNSYDLTCYVYDLKYNLLKSQITTIVVAANSGPSTSKNVIYFGDSLNAGGQVSTPLRNNFIAMGGTTPNFKGTMGSAPNNFDSIGGYAWSDYATKGRDAYRVYVSGIGAVGLWATYSNNGGNFDVIEINVTGGTGNLLLLPSSGIAPVLPNGTLTKISGTGDASISYTGAVKMPANPIWNNETNALDVAQYKTKLGLDPEDKIHLIMCQFGINDHALGRDTTTLKNYVLAMYNAFIYENPSCKMVIGLTSTMGNTVNGWGANYGASNNIEQYMKDVFAIREFYLSEFDENPLYPNLYVAPVGLEIDRYYGYDFSDTAISARYTTTEKTHNNGVHPGTPGYEQMADAYFGIVLKLLQ